MVFGTIVPIFAVIALGWLFRHVKIWDRRAVHVLHTFAFYLGFPALIFSAVFRLDLLANATPDDLRFLVGVLAGHLIVAIIAIPTFRTIAKTRDVQAAGPMLLSFGSTAYLGIPFATYAFGDVGTAYAAAGSALLVIVLLLLSMGVLDQHRARAKQQATFAHLLELPFLWAFLAGLLLPLLGITALPATASRILDLLAASGPPTALLTLGAYGYEMTRVKTPAVATWFGIGKVVLPTVATFLLLVALGVSGLHLVVGTSLAATAVATHACVLADEYRIGKALTAGALAVSTLTSLLALSGILWLWTNTTFFQL